MTDPPEPRDPGDDEELSPEEVAEMRELQDFFDSEYFQEMGDDILLDNIGAGIDNRTIYDDLSDTEWTLQDDLADIKEQTEDTPVPELVSLDDAMKIIAEAKKKREEEQAAAQKRAQSQGDDSMPIADDAQAIAQIANDTSALAAMESATSAMGDVIRHLQAAGEALSKIGSGMQTAAEKISEQASKAGGMLGGEEGGNIQAQGQGIGQQVNDALSKIAMVDTSEVAGNLQGVDLAALQGQMQGVLEAIKSAAQRHMGG